MATPFVPVTNAAASLVNPGLNIKESVVMSEDLGSKSVVGTISKAARFMMFATTANAQWAADRIIKESSYPLAEVAIETNRKLFRYEPGDLFKLPYSRYNISGMICRCVNIQEEDLLSGKIIVSALEDPSYAGQSIPEDFDIPVGGSETEGPAQFPAVPLNYFEVREAPYVLVGDEIQVLVYAGRETGWEAGYTLYMSLDAGLSFGSIQDVNSFAVQGILATDYTNLTNIIDDDIGFDVYLPSHSADILQTCTRAELFTSKNLAVIGDEIITWETITPYGSDDRFKIEGIYRMRWGTAKSYHPAGTNFYFLGGGRYAQVTSPEFVLGFTPMFKAVPYTSVAVGSIEYALPRAIEITGIAREPYDPANLSANGVSVDPTYATDIDLAWNPRVRGDGAGLENPDYYTDEENTWEGLFEVQTYVSSALVRTTTGIDNDHFIYTSAMNISDNGSLAASVEFWLRNYIEVTGQTYYSDWVKITVTDI